MDLRINAGLSRMPTWLNRSKSGSKTSSSSGKAPAKSLGETPPVIEKLENHPQLAVLFSYYGALEKIKRKLKQLSGQDAKLVLAKNTVGAADDKGNVYIGVKLLEQHGHNHDLLAGVMAHEWGHLISNQKKRSSLDHLSWEQIYELRREEEAAADAFCGRMLAMMTYRIEPIIEFLKQAQEGSDTVKYYAAPIRAAIITEAYRRNAQRGEATKKFLPRRAYPNPYTHRLISQESEHPGILT
ncbi:MAG: hypothetical protein KDK66_00570 [Deltaproteobacteria bacterium]|nr:hypothetical protein [Deltaproteobacteria bacterium]